METNFLFLKEGFEITLSSLVGAALATFLGYALVFLIHMTISQKLYPVSKSYYFIK